MGGYKGGYDRKIAVAEWTHAAGIPLTVNAVCHKQNMDQMGEMLDLAVKLARAASRSPPCSSTAGQTGTVRR